MLGLTLAEINNIAEARLEHEIDNINSNLYVAYQQAALAGIATNNPKRFPSKAPKIENNNKSKSEVADPEAVYNTIWNIAAMCGRTLDSKPTG